jgi:hypothetical protein
LPAIHLAHVDLAGGKQRPEQHARRVGRRQHSLRLDLPLELLVQTLDSVRCPRAFPLARRQTGEAEEAVAIAVSPDRLVQSGDADPPRTLQSTFAVNPASSRSRWRAGEAALVRPPRRPASRRPPS